MIRFVLAFALIFLVSACAFVTRSQVSPAIFHSTKDAGIESVGNGGNSLKIGKSCVSNVLGVFASGDASIDKAKKDGNITNVISVDYENFGIFGLYAKSCTVVQGS